jgi:hypothetical protein
MAHFNPQRCEDYCCHTCSGEITLGPCGIVWSSDGAFAARVINASNTVVADGRSGYLDNPTAGIYRLQLQCENGADWQVAGSVDYSGDADCSCCAAMDGAVSHVISDLSFLSDVCGSFASSYVFAPKRLTNLGCPEQDASSVCGASFSINYEPNTSGGPWCYDPDTGYWFPANKAAVIAAACFTGNEAGEDFWFALSRMTFFSTIGYSSADSSAGGFSSFSAGGYYVINSSSTVFNAWRTASWQTDDCPLVRADFNLIQSDVSAASIYSPLHPTRLTIPSVISWQTNF